MTAEEHLPMKRTDAERLYEKYTKLGAKVEFKFDKFGHVEWLEITGKGWDISVSNKALTIHGTPMLIIAEVTIDYLLTGK